MQRLTRSILVVGICLLAAILPAKAQDISDTIHQSVSESIANTANIIDDFFVNERRNQEGSKSQVVLSYSGILDDQLSIEHDYLLNVRLHFPKTENKFRFFLRNSVGFEPQSEETDLAATDTEPDAVTQYSAALQYIFTESKLWQVSSRAGVALALPVDPFYRFRVRRLIPAKWIDTRFVQEFYWSHIERFIERSTLEFERLLMPNYFSRLRFELTWGEADKTLDFTNGLALYQRLENKLAVRYEVGYRAELQQRFDLQRVFVNVRYRRNIMKKWMFYEAVPELYRDERDWNRTRFQFWLKLDLVFGKGF